ncbi:MAG: lauroyl acyltransferase [Acidisphaera sp.]|nr:lauroyl acyltransferase [Acidisphaera sp.]
MAGVTLLWRLEAALVGACLALLRALGPARASDLGGALARAIGPLLPVSRIARRNLRLAMPELDAAARRRVVRGVWDNLGRTVAELPHLPALRRSAGGPGWEMPDAAIMRDLAARGGPVIFFSGHIGNWEMLVPVAAAFGLPIAGVYRAAQNPLIDAMVGRLRAAAASGGAPLFPKGAAGARAAFQHLGRGGCLGLLMDQKLNEGIAVPFFGRPAMTSTALAAMALRFRCPVVPSRVQRTGPARFRMIAEPPLPLPDTGDREADVASLTRQVNERLERWIRAEPESWLWLHRRWREP